MPWLFGSSIILIVYIYLGYPSLVWFLARCFGKDPQKRIITPPVTLFIPAYNEEAHIEAKLRNSLALDYPKEQLRIVVASDGSTDRTNEIASQFADQGVQLVAIPENVGKAEMLSRLVPEVEGDIVVFSDTSSELEPDALKILLSNFADDGVGCVSGLYRLRKGEETDSRTQSEGFYWRYETFIKYQESRLHSILGAHGAFYAMRKQLFTPLTRKSINDDYILAMRVVNQGYRCVYEPGAVAWERELSSVQGEFARRRRIAAGNVQQLIELWPLLNPFKGWIAFCFFSHKGLRTFSPVFLITLLLGSFALTGPQRGWAIGGQLLFYGAAWLGHLRQKQGKPAGILAMPTYFTLANVAMLAGLVLFSFGGRMPKWGHED